MFAEWLWGKKLDTLCWVINLDKNTSRLNTFMHHFQNSDLSNLKIKRFSAIYGKEIDIRKYVTPGAYKNMLLHEKNGYRTRHYHITRGAVGCYLSHMEIYKKLLQDEKHDYYLVFEDDAKILPHVKNTIADAIDHAPADWDMIVFAPILQFVSAETQYLKKFKYFWGLIGYAISKEGARKFLAAHDKINMQIDSKMTYMIINNQFNVYATKKPIVMNDRSQGTDIQMPVLPDGNPYLLDPV